MAPLCHSARPGLSIYRASLQTLARASQHTAANRRNAGIRAARGRPEGSSCRSIQGRSPGPGQDDQIRRICDPKGEAAAIWAPSVRVDAAANSRELAALTQDSPLRLGGLQCFPVSRGSRGPCCSPKSAPSALARAAGPGGRFPPDGHGPTP